jgi:FtsH-binding integral membrane protein
MLAVHRVVAFAVLGSTAVAAVWGGYAYFRGGRAGALLSHVLVLVQTLLIAQVALGLLLRSDERRTEDDLHYVYGSLALGAVLAPWLYAPAEPRRRLAWFAGATLVAGALAVRAYTTA